MLCRQPCAVQSPMWDMDVEGDMDPGLQVAHAVKGLKDGEDACMGVQEVGQERLIEVRVTPRNLQGEQREQRHIGNKERPLLPPTRDPLSLAAPPLLKPLDSPL